MRELQQVPEAPSRRAPLVVGIFHELGPQGVVLWGPFLYILCRMAEEQNFIPVPAKELEIIKARAARTILSVQEQSINGLQKLLHRLDGIDDALANSLNLDQMTPQELYAYFNQAQQSFRLRQDFLRSCAGYEVDTSGVPTDAADKTSAHVIDEATAERVHQEIMNRTVPSQEVKAEEND